MAVIRRYTHFRIADGEHQQEILLEVDARVVGTIETTSDGRFFVSTKGWVPAIDDITGTSFDDVWRKISDRVRSGEVYLTKPITHAETI